MKSLLKTITLLGSTFLSLLLLVSVIAWGIAHLDPNDYRQQISHWLSQQSGRTITITDSIAYDFMHPTSLRLNGVEVEGPYVRLHLKQARARLSLLWLFIGQIRLARVTVTEGTLEGPHPGYTPPADRAGSSPGQNESSGARLMLNIGQMRIEKLQVSYPLPHGPLQLYVEQIEGRGLRFGYQEFSFNLLELKLSGIRTRLGQTPLSIEHGALELTRMISPSGDVSASIESINLRLNQTSLGDSTLKQLVLSGQLSRRRLELHALQLNQLALRYREWFKPRSDAAKKPFHLPWLETITAELAQISQMSFRDIDNPHSLAAEHLELTLQDLELPISQPAAIRGQGHWHARQVAMKPYRVTAPMGTFSLGDSRMSAELEYGTVLGGGFTGNITTLLGSGERNTRWQIRLDDIQVAELDAAVDFIPGSSSGRLDFSAQGVIYTLPEPHYETRFQLTSDKLTFDAFSLDDTLEVLLAMERLDNLLLADIPLVAYFGPIAAIALHSVDAGVVLHKYKNITDKATKVRQVRLDGHIAGQKIQFNDLAIATSRHRLAVRGTLDQELQRYQDVIIAILNDQGCARMTLIVNGSYSEPGYSSRRLKTPGKCEPFYQGEVKHPD